MGWLRWGARNVGILLALLVAGSALLGLAAAVGWGTDDERVGPYVLLGIYAPFASVLYLAVLAWVATRVARPRAWAVGLTPRFWVFVPIFAIGVNNPGIAALWLVFLTFGAVVRLPAGQDRAQA